MTNIFTVTMPDIGEGVVEGEVITWLKNVGDPIGQDEPVVMVMTDKATVELPAPYPGKLAKQYYQVGETAIKDKPLYDIALEGGLSQKTVSQAKAEAVEKKAAKESPIDKLTTGKREEKTFKKREGEKTLAAPPVRKLAKDLGIDINLVPGSGPSGRVLKEDIRRYHSNLGKVERKPRAEVQSAGLIQSATPLWNLPGDQSTPILGIKNLMAEKMVESKTIIPHFSYFEQADASRLVSFRDKLKNEASQKKINLTFMPFFIRALSLCIREHPLANGSVDMQKNGIVIHKVHNIGIAMASPLGLIVPVLKNVQEMNLYDIIYAYEALKEKGKRGKLSPGDMKEATITITNFGALAGKGTFATPIINYPEAAILGVARIHKEPVVINNELAMRSILNCSWSFDHRIIDGDEASKIAHDFAAFIESPAKLL